jgi:hypothetical protein
MSLILMPFQDLPFNGDIYIQREFLRIKKKYNLNVAVETGSCLFSTTEWLAKNFDRVYTCENNPTFFAAGVHKVKDMNVRTIMNDSVIAMDEIAADLKEDDRVIFFLDAHWGEHCPLNEEIAKIAFMTKLKQPPIIAIHDWQVPEHPELGFDTYQEKPFTFELIAPSIAQVETLFNEEYKYYFNSEAEGAKRGIIYLYPSRHEASLLFEMMAAATLENDTTTVQPKPLNMADPALNTLIAGELKPDAGLNQEEKVLEKYLKALGVKTGDNEEIEVRNTNSGYGSITGLGLVAHKSEPELVKNRPADDLDDGTTELMKEQMKGRELREKVDKPVVTFDGIMNQPQVVTKENLDKPVMPADTVKEAFKEYTKADQVMEGIAIGLQLYEPQATSKILRKYKVDKGAIIRLFGKPVVIAAPMYFSTETDLFTEVTNKTLLRGFYVMEDVDWKPLFTE